MNSMRYCIITESYHRFFAVYREEFETLHRILKAAGVAPFALLWRGDDDRWYTLDSDGYFGETCREYVF